MEGPNIKEKKKIKKMQQYTNILSLNIALCRCTVLVVSQLSFNWRLLISLLRIIHCKIQFQEEIFLNSYYVKWNLQVKNKKCHPMFIRKPL